MFVNNANLLKRKKFCKITKFSIYKYDIIINYRRVKLFTNREIRPVFDEHDLKASSKKKKSKNTSYKYLKKKSIGIQRQHFNKYV